MSKHKLFLPIFFSLLIYSTLINAFTPWFLGTSLTNTTTGTTCSKSYQPPSPANFFLGETLQVIIDPADPTNTPVITLNAGNNNINFKEACWNGDLVETACGDAYLPTTPINGVYAAQFTANDVQTITGTTQPLTCVWSPSGAFFAYTAPTPYTYSNTAGIFLLGVVGVGNFYGIAGPATGQSITALYLVGPLPFMIAPIASAGPCAVGAACSLPITPVTCPGTYHLVALQSNNVAAITSAFC